jgi:hypothetical protein
MLDALDVEATSHEPRASVLADLCPLALGTSDGLRGSLDYHDRTMRLLAR